MKINDECMDKCDNCEKEWPTDAMWFAYQFSHRIVLCDDCYNEADRPVDYMAMRKWQTDHSPLRQNEKDVLE